MTNSNGHGGKRRGAGRKPNLTFYQEVTIGQTCERLLSSAALRAINRRKRDLFEHQTELSYHWKRVNNLTLEKRKELANTDLLIFHRENIEAELKLLTPFDARDQEVPRLLRISKRPPKGTRDKVIARAARFFNLKPSQVDNIWQKYRRLERALNRKLDC